MVNKNSTSEAKFDFKNYIIDKAPETRTVTIPETGDEFEVMVKDLSWSKRNQLLSKALQFNQAGETKFSADMYVRECLKEMIVEAPWGNTTESFLLQIDNRLGAALEALVPQAFDDVADAADAVKKG